MFEFDALYVPESRLKSYTLAKPISFPAIPVALSPTLESLRLRTYVFPIPIVGDP